MISKLKNKAMHYWSDHKIETIVFVILVVALIVKQNYGDSQDELLRYRLTDSDVNYPGFLRRSTCPINH